MVVEIEVERVEKEAMDEAGGRDGQGMIRLVSSSLQIEREEAVVVDGARTETPVAEARSSKEKLGLRFTMARRSG